jgi:hypothetical protein
VTLSADMADTAMQHTSAGGYNIAAVNPRVRCAAGWQGGAKAPKEGTRGSSEWPGHCGVELSDALAVGEEDGIARPTSVLRGVVASSTGAQGKGGAYGVANFCRERSAEVAASGGAGGRGGGGEEGKEGIGVGPRPYRQDRIARG